MTAADRMKVGEVADRLGMSVRTLRHYEDVDLVSPTARTDGNFRLYTEDDVRRLLIIRRMKPLGYSLEQMRTILQAVDAVQNPSESEPATAAATAVIDEVRADARNRYERLLTHVRYATEFIGILDDLDHTQT
jgi:DNA-binding transcriptional MerR regulator